MDKTPWIPNKKSTKADLKRILEIMGVVPPDGYDASELRELVTETHTEFMSLVTEGTLSAAAAAADRLAESASASRAAAATGLVATHRRDFQVDSDDPPIGGGGAGASSTSGEGSHDHKDELTFMQHIDKKRQAIQDTQVLLEEMRHLSAEGDKETQTLVVNFVRDSVGMSPSDLVHAMAQLKRQIRPSASGIVVSRRPGFELDFNDPPLGAGAAGAATAPDEYSVERVQLINNKFKAVENAMAFVEKTRHLSTEGDTATQMLIGDLVRDMAQLKRQIRAGASSSDVIGHCEELEYAAGAASRGGTDDI